MREKKLSVVIIAGNEAENIVSCLDSLAQLKKGGLLSEVLLIDDFSADQTAQIAKKRGLQVFQRKLEGDFAGQRNFALKKAKGNWVLFLDADERLSPALSSEIVRRVEGADKKGIAGFYFQRVNHFLGHPLCFGESANARLLRLAKKDSGQWQGKVHEIWQVKGKTELLKNKILHYPATSLTSFLTKLNFYTGIRAKELAAKGEKFCFYQLLLNPMAKFCQNYFYYQGFRDRLPGFIFSLLMAFHSFLVRAKLWQIKSKE